MADENRLRDSGGLFTISFTQKSLPPRKSVGTRFSRLSSCECSNPSVFTCSEGCLSESEKSAKILSGMSFRDKFADVNRDCSRDCMVPFC